MALLSFNILQGKYDKILNVIEAYNAAHPHNQIVDENDFAKQGFNDLFDTYNELFKNRRLASVSDQLLNCSTGTWSQITGLLG